MSAAWIANILTIAILGGGGLFTAGQLVAILKQLQRIGEDHETRIRLLEVQDPHVRPAERRR